MKDRWNSRLGIILAAAGCAVGLGNYLRFPGQAAEYGGGAFLIAYLVAFVLMGLPLCWVEWTLGRYGGQRGFHSFPGILNAVWRSSLAKYVGVLGVIVPLGVYIYYVYIEAWCLGYAFHFIKGDINFTSAEASTNWWAEFIGVGANGSGLALNTVSICLVAAFALNIWLVYRGISKGIEKFCNIAMPLLMILSVVVLVRVLTLGTPDAQHPDRNVENGLGFMWNPSKSFLVSKSIETGEEIARESIVDRRRIASVQGTDPYLAEIAKGEDGSMVQVKQSIETTSLLLLLMNPELWLAAAGQVFFSISAGFGVIMVYASYLRKKDDIVLSGLAAASTNELCEVGFGGLITIPAAVAFLGVSSLVGIGVGTFDLGFKVLPLVFSTMPLGQFFGTLWFFLLFLAAVTSSVSLLQPGLAFLEEALRLGRKNAILLLGLIMAFGTIMVVYFSKDLKALDTLDFWVGTFLVFVVAMAEALIFAWVFGVSRGFKESEAGSLMRIPNFFRPILAYVTPLFLLIIFGCWVVNNVLGWGSDGLQGSPYVKDLFVDKNEVAIMSVGFIVMLTLFFMLLVSTVKSYRQFHKKEEEWS